MLQPYRASQNGLAEQMNRTLMENAHCILVDSVPDPGLCGYAVLTAANIDNRLLSHAHQDISSIEHWPCKVPGVGHLRVCGSTAWVHVPQERRQKSDPKSVNCVLVGYKEDPGSRVHQLYDPSRKKIPSFCEVLSDKDIRINDPPSAVDSTIIGWEKDIENREVYERKSIDDDFQPLDTITPQTGIYNPDGTIQKTITVHPRLVSVNIRGCRQNTMSTISDQPPSEAPRSQRRGNQRGLVASEPEFPLLANSNTLDPPVLTEARGSQYKEQWQQVWESELNLFAKKIPG